MAQFLGDIAFILEVLGLAAGLVLLHRARREDPSNLLKAAGWILTVSGVAGVLCTTYFWLGYNAQGEFASAYQDCQATGMLDE